LQAVESIRKKRKCPLLLFSYFQSHTPVWAEKLSRDARAAGVDGILVTDIIPEEGEQYCACMEANELDAFSWRRLQAASSGLPNSTMLPRFCLCRFEDRRHGSAAGAFRFGASTVERVRRFTQLPVAVGFGISRPEQVQAIWEISDAAVVGAPLSQRWKRR